MSAALQSTMPSAQLAIFHHMVCFSAPETIAAYRTARPSLFKICSSYKGTWNNPNTINKMCIETYAYMGRFIIQICAQSSVH